MERKQGTLENLVNKDMFIKKFSGKRVFLTGHTGFKGTWMILYLKSLGAIVRGYSNEVKDNSLYRHINGDEYCDSKIGNVCDLERLQSEINSFVPDYIFHFAAQPLVRLSYDIPVETFSTNVIGTLNILEVLRSFNKVCKCIIVTTDKVYKNEEKNLPFKETDELGGHDPYSASKSCAEMVTNSYLNSYFLKSETITVATARAGNVIGGGDFSEDRLIPDIVQGILEKQVIKIRNPNAVRPWQHVLEALTGYLLLASKMDVKSTRFSGAWNFGPYAKDNLNVYQVTKMILESWGSGQLELLSKVTNKHESNFLKLDISKSLDLLGWKPIYNSSEAIDLCVKWYKSFSSNPTSALDITNLQIEQYFSGNSY